MGTNSTKSKTLYNNNSIGYTSPYSIEKNYLIATQKRNLLLRDDVTKTKKS
jgi:hypothetical protein